MTCCYFAYNIIQNKNKLFPWNSAPTQRQTSLDSGRKWHSREPSRFDGPWYSALHQFCRHTWQLPAYCQPVCSGVFAACAVSCTQVVWSSHWGWPQWCHEESNGIGPGLLLRPMDQVLFCSGRSTRRPIGRSPYSYSRYGWTSALSRQPSLRRAIGPSRGGTGSAPVGSWQSLSREEALGGWIQGPCKEYHYHTWILDQEGISRIGGEDIPLRLVCTFNKDVIFSGSRRTCLSIVGIDTYFRLIKTLWISEA